MWVCVWGVGRAGGGGGALASLDLICARGSGDIVTSLSQVQLAAIGQSLVALLARVLQTVDATLPGTHCWSM